MNKRDTTPSKNEDETVKHTFLPQFTRLFSANYIKRIFSFTIQSLIWVALLFLLAANVLLSHSGIATYVENSLRTLSQSTKTTNVLGTTSDKIEESPTAEDLKNQYARWNKIVDELPDYRDGHFVLATIAYQLGDTGASRKHLMKVKDMDPNFPGLFQLEALLGQE